MDTSKVLVKFSTLDALNLEEQLTLEKIAIDVLHALMDKPSTKHQEHVKLFKLDHNVIVIKDTTLDLTVVLPAHQVHSPEMLQMVIKKANVILIKLIVLLMDNKL